MVIYSPRLISMSIHVCDVKVLVLLSLLLAKIKTLSCFFMLLVVLNNFLTILVAREKIKVKLALAILTGAPTTLVNEEIDTPPVVALKRIKILSMYSKAATYLLSILLYFI